jgi:acetyl esterase/lipase
MQASLRSWALLLGLAGLAAPASARPYKVEVARDLVYHHVENDPDRDRHRLDVYRPRGEGPFPVLVFFHGGGWTIGQKDNYLGFYGYGTIAHRLAETGLVVVLPNYRLSPRVRHPEHVEDAARAFAWTYRNIANHGGDPEQLFLGGHSAGGHLATLLATDRRYLRAVGHTSRDIRGVIGVSGVYRIDDLELNLFLPGPGGAKLIRTDVRPFSLVFGDDPRVARDASPLNHVRPGLPPFLLINAGFDYQPLPRMARQMADALEDNGCEVQTHTIFWRTHETVLFDIPRHTIDAVTRDLIVKFIASCAAAP